ncbi:MAG: glycine cleavage system aminomethyltransferase GcvT [Fuerstiella sp.]
MDETLRQSPLNDCHLALGARMVPFAGWNMPVMYQGILPEHAAVRTSLGVFDISHMGQITVSSSDDAAAGWLDRMLTNNVASLGIGQGQYSFLLNNAGGVIDDLIVYRQAASDYFLVVNASKTAEDFAWLRDHQPAAGIGLEDISHSFAGLAVQGPQAVEAFQKLFGTDQQIPERFCMSIVQTDLGDVIVCRTGYTGEDGFELFCAAGDGVSWWQRCLDAGATPCGLGARDSLRLEKCYPLNGNDLSPDRTPLEAGLGFAVDLSKPDFVGREALLQQKETGLKQRLVAIRQTEKCPPPRAGYAVFSGEEQVGVLTSGGISSQLGSGISLAYVKAGSHRIGTVLDIEIRGRRFPGQVVKKPFV